MRLEDELALKFRYQKLPIALSDKVKLEYIANIPQFLSVIKPIYTLSGTKVANRFDRIVVGDYGAYIEISPNDIITDNIVCKKGQEYRYTDNYNIKYYWLTAIDDSGVKIYHQQKTVKYADYKPDYYYISVYDVKYVMGDMTRSTEHA